MHTTFAGRRLVVGVTGSIAAFKIAGWISSLAGEEAVVDVIMTRSAEKFITPLSFSSLTGRQVFVDMFEAERDGEMRHISLGRDADCIVVAPATAQTIARLANGMAEDLVTAAVLAARAPIIICPAMNVHMYNHPATVRNIEQLGSYGYTVVEPGSGRLACGDEGTGRLPDWNTVREYLLKALADNDLAGQRVLVTAGPTREHYDPARFISNRSSGKMGYALARTAFRRGADVTLISGPTSLQTPAGVNFIRVESAEDMYHAVMGEAKNATIVVKAAAVSDFRSAVTHEQKVKKQGAELLMELKPNRDILKELGKIRNDDRQVLVGFAAESTNIKEEGKRKLKEKNLDLIAVNDISGTATGFEGDSNQLLLIDRDKETLLPHTTKEKTADMLWDYLVNEKL